MAFIGRLNIVKMSVFPNLIYKVNAVDVKFPEIFDI